MSLSSIENLILGMVRSLTYCRYAFSVVLPEDKYLDLLELSSRLDPSMQEAIDSFPWCHLKLITGTYVRVFDKCSNDKGIIHLLEEVIGDNFRCYWESIPGILKKLNLKRVREERGPWYIYANVVLHSGIPSAYFNELFGMAKESFRNCGEDLQRTIGELSEKRDIFKYKGFSKYFEMAFQSPVERKLFFLIFSDDC